MGLREEKRARMQLQIIENAIALFRENGFGRTPVAEIARKCDISQATFFNHFPTKDAVLSRWAYSGLWQAFADADRVSGSLRLKLRALGDTLARWVAHDPELAAESWRRARVAPPGSCQAAHRMVEDAQATGELRRDLSPDELAAILVGVAADAIARHLTEQTHALSLQARLRAALDLIVDGSRRRHERVRMRPGTVSISTR